MRSNGLVRDGVKAGGGTTKNDHRKNVSFGQSFVEDADSVSDSRANRSIVSLNPTNQNTRKKTDDFVLNKYGLNE